MATGFDTATLRPTIHPWVMLAPLLFLPTAVLLFGNTWPAWVLMWALAFALYVGFKWLALSEFASRDGVPRWPRIAGFLILWPGMDADAFFDAKANVPRPPLSHWLFALAKIALGCAILFGLSGRALSIHPLIGGWTAMVGIAFILHFGIIHLLAVAWRRAEVNVTPIMHAPILSNSVSDFWSRRWNLAFRDLVHRFVFRPVSVRFGPRCAMWAVFLLSGLMHDFVISLTARGGYGLPTLYFVLQGAAMSLERSQFGKRIGLRGGIVGRMFAALVVVVPMGLLFPPVFVERVVLPMLESLSVT